MKDSGGGKEIKEEAELYGGDLYTARRNEILHLLLVKEERSGTCLICLESL
jgi:hypothetical protein